MSEPTRIESDSLGNRKIPENVLWGIHTLRASENFPISGLPQSRYFYKAFALVKLAATMTNHQLGFLSQPIAIALITTLNEMAAGQWIEYWIVDPIQGGAGTSTNMNINEIAANRTNQLLAADEQRCDAFNHVNLHQSTNDVYPTALKIAAYYYLIDLEKVLNNLLQALQTKETEFASILTLARTELMPAVPYTLGRKFSAYCDMIGRDRWRIFKCQERIRQINLGGTAIGTGMAAPKKYILTVSETLKQLTGLPLSRAENLVDATQNHDQLAEVFAMIKVVALNLEKLSHDVRLLSAFGEITCPAVQVGSSIMPGKINPVIPEMLSIIAKKVIGNEATAALCIAGGELELNAFLPLVAYTLFESLELLIRGIPAFTEKCILPLQANAIICMEHVLRSPTSATILLPKIGYAKACEVATYMQTKTLTLREAVHELNIMSPVELDELLTPESLNGLGYD